MTPIKLQSIRFANSVKVSTHLENEYFNAEQHHCDIELHNFWVRVHCKKTGMVSWTSAFNTIYCVPVDPSQRLGEANEESKQSQGKAKTSNKGQKQNKPEQTAQDIVANL